MLRQYHPQRYRLQPVVNRLMPVGTIPVGTIFLSTNCETRRTRKLIVEAWLPREIGAGRRDHNGRYAEAYVARGGHLAQVRDLSDGSRGLLADHFIRFAVDHE